MGFFDTIVDIFNEGPDDWRGRMGDSITLLSPETDTEFVAKWRGDSRDMDKKLGIFIYPRVRGNIVQDLDVNSTRYSISLYFDGKDCDLTARNFFSSAKERGLWTVTHPVHGYLELQLVSIHESTDLISNGGYIQIDTDWIEPIDPNTLTTAAEIAGIINAEIDDLNISAVEQFAADLKTHTEALREKVEQSVNGVKNLSNAALDPLFSVVDSLDSLVLAVNTGIQDTLDAAVLEPIVLAGQIQQLNQLPLLGVNDVSSRLDYYDDLVTEIFLDMPGADKITDKDRNHVAVSELVLTSVIAAYAKIAVTGISAAQSGRTIASGRITADQVMSGFSPTIKTLPGGAVFIVDNNNPIQTRSDAIETAQRIADSFADIVAALDTVQENFEGVGIDAQYFSQRQTYSQCARLVALTIQYLLLSSFDLAVERRITLVKPRSPIEITVTEYGTLGDQDVMLDLFLLSNGITGDDIYLLPAGREVLIYV